MLLKDFIIFSQFEYLHWLIFQSQPYVYFDSSQQAHDVKMASLRRHYDAMCMLGCVFFYFAFMKMLNLMHFNGDFHRGMCLSYSSTQIRICRLHRFFTVSKNNGHSLIYCHNRLLGTAIKN